MTRTYGTLAFEPGAGRARGRWSLKMEPAAAVRAKRIFGRAQQTITGEIFLTDTIEVARDIDWFMERWPLETADELTAAHLANSSAEHRVRETTIAEIVAGTRAREPLAMAPAKEPREYQLTAVQLLRARGRLLLTDEVGLGKTFTGLLNLVNADALPALVVPPTHLPRRWLTELREAFPWLTVEVASKTTVPAKIAAGVFADVTIVPYSKLAGWSDHLAGEMKTVIFDEVQELRNGIDTKKGLAAARVAADASYVLGLTATPVYNYGGEVHSIMQILAPGELGTRQEFTREWGIEQRGHIRVGDPAALGSYLREQGLMLGRTRKDVGRELPKTIKIPQMVDSDPAALEAVIGDAAAMARLILSRTATSHERFRAGGELDWKMREATGIGKAPYVAEFCRLILEAENKIILFGWHRAVYEIWNDMLAEYRPVMYTGTESPKKKADAEEAFINGDARILIMSLRSGAGIDGLQMVSNVAVFGELDWSPQVHEQAIGRLRRDGMGDEPPVAYFLNSDSGSDPSVMEVLQVKRNQAEPLVSRDGRLLDNSTQDLNRSRMLAEQVLALIEGDSK